MKSMRFIILSLIAVGIFTQFSSNNHITEEESQMQEPAITEKEAPTPEIAVIEEKDTIAIPTEASLLANDTLYRWDDQVMNWVRDKEADKFLSQLAKQRNAVNHSAGPVEIKWQSLMDIRYRLRYFAELETEIFAPVFNPTIAALHGKEVIIEGYVIPFAEAGELLSLSFSPYTSCYFCGEGSPASVISIYTKDEPKRYKMDDRKKFRGVLHLNHDDPNEFYYVLREAVEN